MKPDDSFSPPLDGLLRGQKLHQILTTFSSCDDIQVTEYSSEGEWGEYVVAVFNPSKLADIDIDENYVGILRAGWWHMRKEKDWWTFEYYEVEAEPLINAFRESNAADEAAEESEDEEEVEEEPAEEDEVEEEVEEEIYVDVETQSGWYRQENEKVEGLTYFEEIRNGEHIIEEFNPEVEAAKPLTRAIIDTYLPERIRSNHS